MTKAKERVDAILDSFYKDHHNQETFEGDLSDELQTWRIFGFSKAKLSVVEAIDFRLGLLNQALEVRNIRKLQNRTETRGAQLNRADVEARIDELESLRSYIKGMVTPSHE